LDLAKTIAGVAMAIPFPIECCKLCVDRVNVAAALTVDVYEYR